MHKSKNVVKEVVQKHCWYEIILVDSAQIGDINSKIKLTTAREITQISYIINSNSLWLSPFDKGIALKMNKFLL